MAHKLLKTAPSSGAVEFRGGVAVDRRASALDRLKAYREFYRANPDALEIRSGYDVLGNLHIVAHTRRATPAARSVATPAALPTFDQWQSCGYFTRRPAAR